VTDTTRHRKDLDWLLDDLAARIPEVRGAMVLSNDGLPTGFSDTLPRPDAEHVAALASGLHSLAAGAGRFLGAGGPRQTMVELDAGFLFVLAAGRGAILAVLVDGNADMALIAYEMARLVRSVGEHLAGPSREGD